jgi:LPXTG-motif cell wall-anchored protein
MRPAALALRLLTATALVAASVAVATPAAAVQDTATYINWEPDLPTLTASVTGFDTRGGTNVVIPPTFTVGGNTYRVTSIAAAAFQAKNLTSISIPSGVTSIGAAAFATNRIATVTIPDTVTSLGVSVFANNRLASVSIGSGLSTIPNLAFTGNVLSSLTIPSTVTTIGQSAFATNSLTSLTIPDTITSLGTYAFANNLLTSLSIGTGITAVPDYAFRTNNLTTFTIPPHIWSIGISSFDSNRLTSLVIPDTVTFINDYAFDRNAIQTLTIGRGLSTFGLAAFDHNVITSLSLPSTLTSIPGYAFRYSQLTSVSIPSSVTSIGNQAFYQNRLTTATIPAAVTSIGPSAFDTNAQLTSVKFLGAAPTTITDAGVGGAQPSLGRVQTLVVDYDPAFSSTFTISNGKWRGYTVRASVPVTAGGSVTTTTTGTVAGDGVQEHTVKASVRNDLGNPAVGATVSFTTSPPVVDLSSTTCVTGTDGTCTITATSESVGTFAVYASITAGSIGATNVTFAPRPATTADSTITSDVDEIVADGQETATVTITARNNLGAATGVSAGTVSATSTIGTLSAVTDNNDGTYTATLTSDEPGDAVVSFTIAGAAGANTVTIEVTPRVAVAAYSIIATDVTTIVADGDDTATITVTARDRDGVALTASGGTVTIESSLGTVSAVTDNGDGTYEATLTGTTAGDATVSFSINGSDSPNTVSVTIDPRPADAASSTIESDTASIIADGTTAATITITARDATGAAVATSAGTVTASSTLGTLSAVTDNGDGTYTATLTGAATGDAVVSFTLGGTAATNTVTVAIIPRPADATTSTITADATSIVANGTDTATITITARDADGNALNRSAGTVTATAAPTVPAVAAAVLTPVTDNGDGTYTTTFSTTTAGSTTIAFRIVGTDAASTITITAVAVAVTPAADGDDTLAVTGADPSSALAFGGVLLALGAALLVRRRRAQH